MRPALRTLLQAGVLCGGAHATAGASPWQEGEPQGASALGLPSLPRPVAVADNESAVLLGRGGVSASFVEAWRVAGVIGIGGVADGDAAAPDVRRVAMGVAVLLVDVLAQLPPLPLFQHL